jgi:hypothetical protein
MVPQTLVWQKNCVVLTPLCTNLALAVEVLPLALPLAMTLLLTLLLKLSTSLPQSSLPPYSFCC